jgi:uncharacterized membrane protein YfhO
MSVVLKLLTLMRLQAGRTIVDPTTGYPTPEFLRNQNDKTANEQTMFSALVEQVNAISAAQEAANTAQATGTEAQTSADTAKVAASAAQASATNVARSLALIASFVSPTNILTATNDGTINVAAHTRLYADGSSVAVNAGTISGLADSTTYYVSYLDEPRAGGSVSYNVSTIAADAAQIADRTPWG